MDSSLNNRVKQS